MPYKQYPKFLNGKHMNRSATTRQLEQETGHGMQEFQSIEDLNEFFTTDPDNHPGATFEPPLFNKQKPSKADKARSEGIR